MRAATLPCTPGIYYKLYYRVAYLLVLFLSIYIYLDTWTWSDYLSALNVLVCSLVSCVYLIILYLTGTLHYGKSLVFIRSFAVDNVIGAAAKFTVITL